MCWRLARRFSYRFFLSLRGLGLALRVLVLLLQNVLLLLQNDRKSKMFLIIPSRNLLVKSAVLALVHSCAVQTFFRRMFWGCRIYVLPLLTSEYIRPEIVQQQIFSGARRIKISFYIVQSVVGGRLSHAITITTSAIGSATVFFNFRIEA